MSIGLAILSGSKNGLFLDGNPFDFIVISTQPFLVVAVLRTVPISLVLPRAMLFLLSLMMPIMAIIIVILGHLHSLSNDDILILLILLTVLLSELDVVVGKVDFAATIIYLPWLPIVVVPLDWSPKLAVLDVKLNLMAGIATGNTAQSLVNKESTEDSSQELHFPKLYRVLSWKVHLYSILLP